MGQSSTPLPRQYHLPRRSYSSLCLCGGRHSAWSCRSGLVRRTPSPTAPGSRNWSHPCRCGAPAVEFPAACQTPAFPGFGPVYGILWSVYRRIGICQLPVWLPLWYSAAFLLWYSSTSCATQRARRRVELSPGQGSSSFGVRSLPFGPCGGGQ